MSDRTGIFAGEDPFVIAKEWLGAASQAEPRDPIAASLASVDPDGMPNVRVVLVKEFEPDAFVFYTNYESAKGRELIAAGKAALGFHWKSIGRQIRIRGLVEKVSPTQSDAYYETRPVESRLGAWASQQSRPLDGRETLIAGLEAARATHGDAPTRPPHWGGFRIRPLELEFWADGAFRLHDRFRWTRPGFTDPWTISRLNP